jgi:hypothetical protein
LFLSRLRSLICILFIADLEFAMNLVIFFGVY